MIYYVNIMFAIGIMLFPQNHSKMKNQISNIALEGTCSGDVVGGLLLWTGESLQALLFWRGDLLAGVALALLLSGKRKPLGGG